MIEIVIPLTDIINSIPMDLRVGFVFSLCAVIFICMDHAIDAWKTPFGFVGLMCIVLDIIFFGRYGCTEIILSMPPLPNITWPVSVKIV